MNKAYKFRIYPTTKQKKIFAKTFGCARFIYNQMLSDRRDNKPLRTPAAYKLEYEWLAEVDSLALCNTQMNLKKAFENHRKNPKHFKAPKFKSRRNRQSYSTIKTVTVSKTPSGEYYVSILVEYENQVLKMIPKTFVGLDYSMKELYVSSDGEIPEYPHFYRKSEKKLSKMQKQFSKKAKDSNNRKKFRIRLSKIHEKVANQRRDFLQKLSYHLVANYDCICIEDLNMQVMSRALRFGKSVHDNGWGMFTRMLEYKCEWYGKTLVKIDKFEPTSQKCHCCGYKNPETKNLSVREWRCPKCGAYHDRDVNAAINIREAGKKLI